MHVSIFAELKCRVLAHTVAVMIYHCIRYTIDPHKLPEFEKYACRWMEDGLIRRCGGEPLGYFLPQEGLG
jgi:hypothetical protein